jgi:AraC-like DNA-binding protein
MTMKSLAPADQEIADKALHWQVLSLPAGLRAAVLKGMADRSEIALPDFHEPGYTLSFINYKGDVRIRSAAKEQPASPGLALMSLAGRPMVFRTGSAVPFAALVLFIPHGWSSLFLGNNAQFRKIEQLLEEESNIITCRLGRRQLSLLSSSLSVGEGKGMPSSLNPGGGKVTSTSLSPGGGKVTPTSPNPGGGKTLSSNLSPGRGEGLLNMQNSALALLEYFLCNRHRSLLGVSPVSDIENEDDLSLIREVESYISEYYCSDTFTVDSILKKTYTSYHRLNFLFKSIHGMTISEYIRNKRIEKSKEMIADNVKSISQIAYEIGYSSISNYILAFKKVYQITPGKYKKQMDSMA